MIKKWLTVIGKTILLLIGITFLSFLLVYHSPGDPAMVALKKSGMRVSEKALELKREELGLNDPFAVQYGRWLNEFFHGDLGESYKTGKAVAGELKKTIPATLLLTVAALALTILISFPIGTDNLGRCVFCRILAGSRTSIYTALLIVGIVFLVGTLVGILAGFAGGVLDEILMKITLVFQAFPAFVLSIAIAGILGVGLWNGVLALSAVYWTTYARLSRSLVVSMKQENYIYAARMNGVPLYRMITAYILPNMMGSLIVTAAMDIGSVILSMAGLSFLGLGAARPTAEWGAVMSEARDYLQKAPWIIVFNGLALFLVVTVFQLFGDRLSEFVHKKEARTEN